ncbi:HNH endonuclease [Nocardioides carbamazepini]|uniref:AAA family ATPase n=1 Tax=Nocardioides carbamazepini TaxID=2854259 RepID=UPI00214A653C|nr:AAA family ATPase [Nocardioides carbamazepini]MCR1785315.1 HNH endonuclease [Nocardioides carbamazepini]
MSQHHHRLSGSTRQKRNAKILKASDICGLCGQPGSDAVDHKVPITRGGTEHPSNLQPVHHDVAPFCNRRKGDLLPAEYDRKVMLVVGPPGAGKTTLAHTIADAEGLEVYDLDDEQWAGSDALFRAALVQLREQPKARAVVIRTGATLRARQGAATACGATELVVVDTALDECIRRIKQRGRTTPPIRIQINGARQWWAKYEPGEVKLSFASLRLQRSGSLA